MGGAAATAEVVWDSGAGAILVPAIGPAPLASSLARFGVGRPVWASMSPARPHPAGHWAIGSAGAAPHCALF